MVSDGLIASASAERVATWLSLACAVHCLVMPVAAAALPLAGLSTSAVLGGGGAGAADDGAGHGLLELALSGSVLVGAGLTGVLGFRRHRDGRVLVVLVLAVALYALGHLVDGWSGLVASVTGALALAAASFASARLMHSHTHDESCGHGVGHLHAQPLQAGLHHSGHQHAGHGHAGHQQAGPADAET